VLDHDRNIGFDNARKTHATGHRGRHLKIVEALVTRAPGRDGEAVRALRVAVLEIQRQGDGRIGGTSVEDAARLVAL